MRAHFAVCDAIIELVGSTNGAVQAIYLSLSVQVISSSCCHFTPICHQRLKLSPFSNLLRVFLFFACFRMRAIKNCLFHFIWSHLYRQPPQNINSHEMAFIRFSFFCVCALFFIVFWCCCRILCHQWGIGDGISVLLSILLNVDRLFDAKIEKKTLQHCYCVL